MRRFLHLPLLLEGGLFYLFGESIRCRRAIILVGKGDKVGPRETAYIHLPNDPDVYFWYPVYQVGSASQQHDPSERIELLSNLFDAYERIRGNCFRA